MTRTKSTFLALLGILAIGPITANADLIPVSGTFAGSSSTTTSAVTAISGAWSGFYDDALVSASGFTQIGFSLASLTLNPNPLGTTIFNITNTSGRASFSNGILNFIGVGGNACAVGCIAGATDDFWAFYTVNPLGAGTASNIAWSLASEPQDIAFADRRGGSFTTQVPEPGTLTLLGLGLLGLGLVRRKTA